MVTLDVSTLVLSDKNSAQSFYASRCIVLEKQTLRNASDITPLKEEATLCLKQKAGRFLSENTNKPMCIYPVNKIISLTCTAEFRKQLFSPGLLISPLL